jgi:hypothetical protein
MTDTSQLNGAIPTELGGLASLTFLSLGKIEIFYCCCGDRLNGYFRVLADTMM